MHNNQNNYFYCFWYFFFFNDTATTEIYTLSLHDALPIWDWRMASYLLFESAYCGELIDLGYADGMAAEQDICRFLES